MPRDLMTTPAGPVAVAVGNIDGVHLGHQALVASATQRARAVGGTAAVLTFSPHPQEFLHPSRIGYRLTTDLEKQALLKTLGMERIVVIAFDASLAGMNPDLFFENYLHRGIHASSVHVGADFRFGRNRSGDTRMLKALGERNQIEVHAIADVLEGGQRISSSRIRTLLQEGKAGTAAQLLGRPYALAGTVVHGSGRGRGLGIPTANTQFPIEKVAPKYGVYATRTLWKGRAFASVSNFGLRPTFASQADPAPALETHLLDFSEPLYGEFLQVQFVDRIRDEKRFENGEALRTQVYNDMETARKRLA